VTLKNPFALKTVFGNTDLELKADPGESFLIKNIFISLPSSNFITLRTEKTTVGYFRVGGNLGSHLPFAIGKNQHSHNILAGADVATLSTDGAKPVDSAGNDIAVLELLGAATGVTYKRALQENSIANVGKQSILDYLSRLGLFSGYPIATGENFKITGASQANAIQVVQYEIHEADDMKADAENGSMSKEYLFMNYGRTSAAVVNSVDTLYDTVQSPAEFPTFPYGKVVPAKNEIDILAFFASDISETGSAIGNYTYSKYLKLVYQRSVLFDEDRNGIPHVGIFPPDVINQLSIAEGQSFFGNLTNKDNKEPLRFPEPLKFSEGDELNIYLSSVKVGTGGSLAVADSEIALCQKVRRIE
jgi:hypothetical protein